MVTGLHLHLGSGSTRPGTDAYLFERKRSGENDYHFIERIAAPATSCVDHTLAAAENATYRLRAVSDSSESAGYGVVEIAIEPVVLGNSATEQPAILLYPNPVQQRRVTVRFNEALTGTLELLRTDGKPVMVTQLDHLSETVLERPPLPAGSYLLRVISRDNVSIKKLLSE